MPTVPVYVKQQVYDRLLQKAQQQKVSVSRLVRELLENHYHKILIEEGYPLQEGVHGFKKIGRA